MANPKKAPKAVKVEGGTRAALLVDCYAGKAGEIVQLDAHEIDQLVAGGQADDNEAAVEYADSQADAKGE